MTVVWERFAGSTDTFAVRMALLTDPHHGAAAEPIEAVSWGAFQLWVDGQNLCAHVDQGEVLQSAHWYLLPLLEWFAESWNALLHEEKLPNRNLSDTAVKSLAESRTAPVLAGEPETVAWETEWYEWRERHALRAARAGGLLPNVVIRRLRDMVEISWDDEPLAGMPSGFRFSASSGAALVEPDRVAGVVFEVIDAATCYLLDQGVGGQRMVALRDRVRGLRKPGQRDQRLSWLAGLRDLPALSSRIRGQTPVEEMESRWSEFVASLQGAGVQAGVDAVLEVEESPLVVSGSCHATLLFSSLSPTVSREDLRTLASVLVTQYRAGGASAALDEVGDDTDLDMAVPAWEQGYDLAEAVHDQLDLDLSDGWVDVAGVVERLGVAVEARKLDDREVRACSLVGPQHRPTIVLNEASSFAVSPNPLRFTLAHEVCHLLFDRSRGRKLAIASGPWAPRGIEQRANAFAAMFLMPERLVRDAVADAPDPITDLDGIAAVAARLRVSRHAVIDHLYNLTLMDESERDDLRRRVREQ